MPQEIAIFTYYVSMIIAGICLMGMAWYIYENRKETVDEQNTNSGNEAGVDEVNEFKKLVAAKNSKIKISGATSRYTWKQNDQEIDIFIPLSNNINRSDIKVEIKTYFIKVHIAGMKVLDDRFKAAVTPDDCNWQIDDWEGTRRLWITVSKKEITSSNEYWKYVLVDDEDKEVDGVLGNLNIPIFNVNSDDPKFIADTISKLK